MTAWSKVPRCTESYCGGACKLERALLICQACWVTRFATPEESRLARAAWEEVVT